VERIPTGILDIMHSALSRPHPFGEQPWTEIASFLGGIAADHADFRYLVDIVDSVMVSGADQLLASATSMHDLLVVPRPVPGAVHELIVVRAPSSLRAAPLGKMRIEHLSSRGHDDCIDRPADQAVRLFWRFVAEKYGLRPPGRST
jgi:hypothetical protein